MSDATHVFEREGFNAIAHVADAGRQGRISAVFDGDKEARIIVGFEEEYDEEYDEFDSFPIREGVDVSAGDIMIDLNDGTQTILKAEQIAESDFRFAGEIEPGTQAAELFNHRVIAVGEMGDLIEYNAETGRLDALPVETPEFRHLAFVDGNGDFVAPVFSGRISDHFQSVVEKADEVEFDMVAFYEAINEGMHVRMEERGDVPGFAKHDVYLLNNAIEVAKAERETGASVSVEAGPQRLSADSWDRALESLGENFRLPGNNSKYAMRKLDNMIPAMAAQNPAIVKTARQIYAPLTDTPMEDIRMYQSPRFSERMIADEDPQATVQHHFQCYLERGERVEIPEETHMAVSRVYAPEALDLVEIEDMKVLLVRDEMTDSLYFFPSNPELIAEADMSEEREPVTPSM